MLQFVYLILYLFFRTFYKFYKPYIAKIPVISVGNIMVGGTGKTPFVSWLISFLKKEGFTPIVVTRGYKSQGKGIRLLTYIQKQKTKVSFYGDEAAMLSLWHPATPILVSPNRIAGFKKYAHLGNIAILDDGMQQLKIKKDLDIGMIDALVGFGNKKLLPAGKLREPLSALQRNDFFVISRCNLQEKKKISAITQILPKNKPHYEIDLIASHLTSSKNEQIYQLKKLKNKKIVLFSGIANPQSFLYLVEHCLGDQGKIIQNFCFPDHFCYTIKNLSQIFSKKYPTEVLFITTEKDWVKLICLQIKLPEFFILKTKLDIPSKLVKNLKGHLIKNKIR